MSGVFSPVKPIGQTDPSEKIGLLSSKPAEPAGQTWCPETFGHWITWFLLIFILGMSAWASVLYLMPLIEKAHTLAQFSFRPSLVPSVTVVLLRFSDLWERG